MPISNAFPLILFSILILLLFIVIILFICKKSDIQKKDYQEFTDKYGNLSVTQQFQSGQYLTISRGSANKLKPIAYFLGLLKTGDPYLDHNFQFDCYNPKILELLKTNSTLKEQLITIFSDPRLTNVMINKSFLHLTWARPKKEPIEIGQTLNKVKSLVGMHFVDLSSCELPLRRSLLLKLTAIFTPLLISFLILVYAKLPPLVSVIFDEQLISPAVALFFLSALIVLVTTRLSTDLIIRKLTALMWLGMGPTTLFIIFVSNDYLGIDFRYSQDAGKLPANIVMADIKTKKSSKLYSQTQAFVNVSFDEKIKADHGEQFKFFSPNIWIEISATDYYNWNLNSKDKTKYPQVTLVLTKGYLGKTYVKEVIFNSKNSPAN